MKKTLVMFMLVCAVFVAACGGRGGAQSDSTENRTVQARIQEPAELAALPADQRITEISLTPIIDGVEGPTAADTSLLPNPDASAYNGTIESLPPSRYMLRIRLEHPFDPSTVIVDGLAKTGDVKNVTVALYEQAVDVVVGESTIIVDTKPSDFSTSVDEDGDGITNLQEMLGTTDPTEPDTDGDAAVDGQDAFPNNSTEWSDPDGDLSGDNSDNCPGAANQDQVDTNHDGEGDVCDSDMDGDGLLNVDEVLFGTDSLAADSDGDTICDGPNTVKDAIGKTVCTPNPTTGNGDNCPLSPNKDQANHGIHLMGDACDTDSDGDGVLNGKDDCPFVSDPDQTNHGTNGSGDACNPDIDADGKPNANDNCPYVANSNQSDMNNNGSGDLCDPDADGDGVPNTQENSAGDDGVVTLWNATDTDGDGVTDDKDNCPITFNPTQESNSDGDGEGDACDCDKSDASITTNKAVFVDVSGSDVATGSRNYPVKTIQKAIDIAVATNKPHVYVGVGTYSGQIRMASGVSIYGGFRYTNSRENCLKKLADAGLDLPEQTTLTSPTSPTILFYNITSETHLEGVTVRNSATKGDQTIVEIDSTAASSVNSVVIENSYIEAPSIPLASTTAIEVNGASPLVINSVIDGGDSQEATAISLTAAPAPKFVFNTIRGGGAQAVSTVLRSLDSVPAFINNILFTEAGTTQQILNFEDTTPSASILVKNNLLFGVKGLVGNQPKLYVDANPSIHIYTKISDVDDTVDGKSGVGAFDGNIRLTVDGTDAGNPLLLTDLFVDPANQNYRQKANVITVNKGMNAHDVVGKDILKDHDSNNRPSGTGIDKPDMGAYEQ